jgi:hypothetical protein
MPTLKAVLRTPLPHAPWLLSHDVAVWGDHDDAADPAFVKTAPKLKKVTDLKAKPLGMHYFYI